MQSILDKLAEWLKELLISGILGNLSGMFDTVNTKVGEIAGEVGMTPSAWNGGVFNLILPDLSRRDGSLKNTI